jgi:hypothetical protein
VTRESFQILATVPQLANIVIEDLMPGGPSLGETRLPATLQEVHLTRCGLTDDDLASIGTLNLVRRLTLRENHIRGPGLVHVARNSGLGTVYLGGNPIDDRYLACFSTMSLNGLDLSGIRLTETGVDAIASQSMLEYLAARASGITDQQLQRIVASTKLRDAELDATNLSPEALKGWRPRDVGLYLEDARVEASDIERLAQFGLDVYLLRCELSADAMAELDEHRQLFDLTDCRVGESKEQTARQ